ncbi:MAG TPA: helix-turn-helix domain-containing protein [Ktedonobacterales bacterium]
MPSQPPKKPGWFGIPKIDLSGLPTGLPDWLGKTLQFGTILRDHRTLRGMSVEEVAAAVGIAPSALRDIEAGKRAAPPMDVVKKLAEVLQLHGEERGNLIDAAEADTPVVHNLFGKEAPKAERPDMVAAILVFVIADIRGYTAFTQLHGDEIAARLAGRFAELARAVAERWDGQVVEVRGDEVLSVFASARQALHAAHDLHERFANERAAQPHLPAGIGIGLDVGEAVAVDGGYRGGALNRAARLCALAGPGEVLVSPGVAYVAPRVEGVRFVPRGQAQLKGFEGPLPILLAAPASAVDARGTDDFAASEAEAGAPALLGAPGAADEAAAAAAGTVEAADETSEPDEE